MDGNHHIFLTCCLFFYMIHFPFFLLVYFVDYIIISLRIHFFAISEMHLFLWYGLSCWQGVKHKKIKQPSKTVDLISISLAKQCLLSLVPVITKTESFTCLSQSTSSAQAGCWNTAPKETGAQSLNYLGLLLYQTLYAISCQLYLWWNLRKLPGLILICLWLM